MRSSSAAVRQSHVVVGPRRSRGPPRNKNAWKTVVGFSRLERALLTYLQGLSHRTMNDELRSALRFYARHYPQFDTEAFAAHVRKHELPETEKGVEREQLIQEVN